MARQGQRALPKHIEGLAERLIDPMRLLLKTTDVSVSKAFYRDRLGFVVRDTEENTCTVEIENQVLIFSESGLWAGEPACTGTVYFSVADLDAYYEKVKDSVAVLWPVQEMSYGSREFGLRDCNGYVLAFAERI